jgi:hypothetical protein
MRILITLFIPLLMMSAGYADEQQNFDERQPDWVTEIMEKEPKFTKITRCVYNDEYVWKVNSCVTCNDMITKVYDKDKNVVCQYGGILRKNTCTEKDMNLQDCEVIYKGI